MSGDGLSGARASAGDTAYRLLRAGDEQRLEASFTRAGRQRFWDR